MVESKRSITVTAKLSSIVIAKLNEIMLGTQLFQAAISDNINTISIPPTKNRVKLLELYCYLYKRPELVMKIFDMDRGTLYCDNFKASNNLIDLIGEILEADRSPSEAVNSYLKYHK